MSDTPTITIKSGLRMVLQFVINQMYNGYFITNYNYEWSLSYDYWSFFSLHLWAWSPSPCVNQVFHFHQQFTERELLNTLKKEHLTFHDLTSFPFFEVNLFIEIVATAKSSVFCKSFTQNVLVKKINHIKFHEKHKKGKSTMFSW